MEASPRPLPILDGRSREVFAAAAEGRLLIQRCSACDRHQFYPRAHCTSCFGTVLEWAESSGRGTLHTFSVVERTPNAEFAEDTPYALAIVDLEEGVRLTSRVVDVPLDELACDMPLRVVFRDVGDGLTMPFFTARESDR